MNIDRIDLDEQLRRAGAHVLYEGPEGRILRQGDESAIYSDVLDGEQLCRIFDKLHISECEMAAVKSKSAADAVSARFGFHGGNPCSQWAYTLPVPPKYPQYDIRILERRDIPLAAAHYHLLDDAQGYFSYCVDTAQIWGLYENDRLAGFIGLHPEGSMGMLEVLPEYRHKGYGYALEAHLIDVHLQRGWVPYCHVIDGNEASLHLQRKLGLTCAALPAIWVY